MPQSKATKEQNSKNTTDDIAECNGDIIDDSRKLERDASPSEDGSVPVSPIARLFGVQQEQTSRCTKCGSENSKTSPVLLSSLILQDLEGLYKIYYL